MLCRVHLLERGVQQALLLVPGQPAVSSLSDFFFKNAEAVKREQRRRLHHAPVKDRLQGEMLAELNGQSFTAKVDGGRDALPEV